MCRRPTASASSSRLSFACSPSPSCRGGALGEVDVEHVEVAAAAAEPDHLTVEGGDQVDVVGLQIAQHQRQHPEPGQAKRHPPDAGALPEPLQAHHERGRRGQQAGALKPADRIPAHRRAGQQMLAQRRADQRRAGADRERPQPARLNARAAPLRGRLQVHAATAPRPVPAARTGQQRPLRPSCAFARRRPGAHSAWRTCSGIFRCAGRNSPTGSAAANAESCEPHTGRRLTRAVGARFSTAARRDGSCSALEHRGGDEHPEVHQRRAPGFLLRGRARGLLLHHRACGRPRRGVDPELGVVQVALDDPRGLTRIDHPVQQRDPLAGDVAVRGDQPGEHVLAHLAPGRLRHRPGHATPRRRASSSPRGRPRPPARRRPSCSCAGSPAARASSSSSAARGL